jgi:hypothetical protein
LLKNISATKASSSVADPADPYALGLLDPDPKPLVQDTETDPAPDPYIIKKKLFCDFFT